MKKKAIMYEALVRTIIAIVLVVGAITIATKVFTSPASGIRTADKLFDALSFLEEGQETSFTFQLPQKGALIVFDNDETEKKDIKVNMVAPIKGVNYILQPLKSHGIAYIPCEKKGTCDIVYERPDTCKSEELCVCICGSDFSYNGKQQKVFCEDDLFCEGFSSLTVSDQQTTSGLGLPLKSRSVGMTVNNYRLSWQWHHFSGGYYAMVDDEAIEDTYREQLYVHSPVIPTGEDFILYLYLKDETVYFCFSPECITQAKLGITDYIRKKKQEADIMIPSLLKRNTLLQDCIVEHGLVAEGEDIICDENNRQQSLQKGVTEDYNLIYNIYTQELFSLYTDELAPGIIEEVYADLIILQADMGKFEAAEKTLQNMEAAFGSENLFYKLASYTITTRKLLSQEPEVEKRALDEHLTAVQALLDEILTIRYSHSKITWLVDELYVERSEKGLQLLLLQEKAESYPSEEKIYTRWQLINDLRSGACIPAKSEFMSLLTDHPVFAPSTFLSQINGIEACFAVSFPGSRQDALTELITTYIHTFQGSSWAAQAEKKLKAYS